MKEARQVVEVLSTGDEEKLAEWAGGFVPRRAEAVSIEYLGTWRVVADELTVRAFVYVEKEG